MKLIAITGGIGAGKSVVSHILRAMGFEVYDCDSHAKYLMDESSEIKRRICTEISPAAVDSCGDIDRTVLSSVVFADPAKLAVLNSIVHHAVIDDIKSWSLRPHTKELLFVETAILYQSRLDRLVDEVWEITAPDELRIARVIARNGCDRDAVAARMRSQSHIPAQPHHIVREIINDNLTPLLPQIETLLAGCNG